MESWAGHEPQAAQSRKAPPSAPSSHYYQPRTRWTHCQPAREKQGNGSYAGATPTDRAEKAWATYVKTSFTYQPPTREIAMGVAPNTPTKEKPADTKFA